MNCIKYNGTNIKMLFICKPTPPLYLTITLSLLLVVSVSYYILDQMFEQRENFEEDDEIRPTPN